MVEAQQDKSVCVRVCCVCGEKQHPGFSVSYEVIALGQSERFSETRDAKTGRRSARAVRGYHRAAAARLLPVNAGWALRGSALISWNTFFFKRPMPVKSLKGEEKNSLRLVYV